MKRMAAWTVMALLTGVMASAVHILESIDRGHVGMLQRGPVGNSDDLVPGY